VTCCGILDALDVDRAHLVGLSMGGGIAQEVAARHPDRVATITVVATSPAGRRQDESPLPPPEPRVAETFGNPPPEPDWTDREAVVDHLVESYRPYAGSLGFDEPAARRLVEHVVGRTVDIEAASKNHWLVAGDDEDDGFAMTDVVAPTLVIHGTTDPMFPLAHGEALAREIGDATLLRVPGWATSARPSPSGPRPPRRSCGTRGRGHWTTTTAASTRSPPSSCPADNDSPNTTAARPTVTTGSRIDRIEATEGRAGRGRRRRR
jgi:pimeloyl-ACP methyl ester carboxylesterase